MRTLKRTTNIVKKAYESLGNYLSPSNFTYMWSLGSLALICLIIQIISGLFLSMFYNADINMAFASVEYINRELYYGWLIRYIHMNGASIFFLVVYLHMSKHMLYGSYTYPRQVLWFSGMIIFILMMATAFMGYVLPWGQMSIWGATVITSLFSAIPVIGIDFVYWLWGGLSIDNATLSRFYSLHFLLPFIILAVSLIHLVLLHEFGSNNALGIIYRTDNIPFYINYMIKDLYAWICLFLFFHCFVFLNTDYFGHPDNYILGNFMVTPTHIVPEWYFLPLYAILRSIPSKLGGLIILGIAFLFLIFWPAFVGVFQLIRNSLLKPYVKYLIPLFYVNLIILGWIGGQSAEPLYIFLGQLSVVLYFLFFFFFVFFNIIEFYFIILYRFFNITKKNNFNSLKK